MPPLQARLLKFFFKGIEGERVEPPDMVMKAGRVQTTSFQPAGGEGGFKIDPPRTYSKIVIFEVPWGSPQAGMIFVKIT